MSPEQSEIEVVRAAINARLDSIVERKKTAPVEIQIVKMGVFEVMGYSEDEAKESVRGLPTGKLEKLKAEGIVKMSVPKSVLIEQTTDIKAIIAEIRKVGFAASGGGAGTPKSPDKVTNFENTLRSDAHKGQTGADIMFDKLSDLDPTLEKQDDGTYVGELIKIHKYDPTSGKLSIAYRTSTDGLWKGYNMNNPGTLAWNVKKAFGIVGNDTESAS